MNDVPEEHEAEPETGPGEDAVVAESTGAFGGNAEPPDHDAWTEFVHGPEVAEHPWHRKKRALVASGSAVIIVAAVVGGVVASAGKPSAPGSGMAPADFVVSSTQTTLAQRTADVTFSGSVTADGKVIPLNGTGEADFNSNTFSASISENTASTSLVIRELVASGHFYMGMTINGQDISQVTGGVHWVSIALPDQSGSSSLGATNVDPLSQLKALEQKGATVTSLGTSTVDGTTVSGYSVTPNRREVERSRGREVERSRGREVENDIEQEIQQNQISAALGQQMLKESNTLGTFTTQVWIDRSGLIRQEIANVAGGSSGVAAKVTTTFQNYGAPVSIAPPAPNDVIPFEQFLNELKSAQASPA